MRRIKLFAYWAENLGDDLMVHILLKRYPSLLFYSDTYDYNDKFCNYSNFCNLRTIENKYGRLNHILNILTLNCRPDWYMKRCIRRFEKGCEAAVYIGGSVYMENPRQSIEDRLSREEKKMKNQPLFVIGSNFGPYKREEFKNAFSVYFSKCEGVTFRDKYSYELFSNLGNKIKYAPDVVFNLDIDGFDRTENSQTVLISVINLNGRNGIEIWKDVYERRIAEICEECVQSSKTPVLMSFCEAEKDGEAIQRILGILSPSIIEEVKTYNYRGDLDEVLKMFAKADRIIATRFHAMILALRFSKPLFCISYSTKTQNVMDDLECDNYCVMEQIDTVNATSILQQCQIKKGVQNYIGEAEKQFLQFDDFIGSGKQL